MSEKYAHLQSRPSGTAPGIDSIPTQLLKCCGRARRLFLLSLFNTVLSSRLVPSQWRSGEIICSRKGYGPLCWPITLVRTITFLPTIDEVCTAIWFTRACVLTLVLSYVSPPLLGGAVVLLVLCAAPCSPWHAPTPKAPLRGNALSQTQPHAPPPPPFAPAAHYSPSTVAFRVSTSSSSVPSCAWGRWSRSTSAHACACALLSGTSSIATQFQHQDEA